MPKNPFSRSKGRDNGAKELENLKESLGDDLSPEERLYLDELQRRATEGPDFNNPEALDVELRRREQQRMLKNYKPATPLYKPGQSPSSSTFSKPIGNDVTEAEKQAQRKSYQDDPRYREFYKRLRKQSDPPSNYDQDVEPTTLEELEKQGWDGSVKPPAPTLRPTSSPQARQTPPQPQSASSRPAPPDQAAGSIPCAGTLYRLDDDSIAIYKDAVSGKDYALFYFLEPNGLLAPRGIFLEQYEKQRIGCIPEETFEQMRAAGRWDRDAVIFYLDDFQYRSLIQRLESRTPTVGFQQPASSPRPVKSPVQEPPQRQESSSKREPVRVHTPPPVERDPLERGRVVRINVAGRVWESVYWTNDEIGPIVAHDTNREWSLMHLDLGRFKDSIEYGDLLEPDRLQEIEDSLARQRR